MASQRSSSATLQSDIKDSAFTNSSPSWAHKEWLQYYNYPSLSQPSAPGHGMGESHITTLSSPTLGLKRQHTALENTSREPHSENAHSYGSDTRQSHTYTPPSPARHPWQRSAGEDTTTTPSLATIHSLIGSSGQASPAPSILSSLGNEGSVYYNPTAGVSSPIGASFLIPQQVALPGGSSLRNSRQQYRGSTNRPSSCSEDECCVTPSSPTVRYHVDSATLFGDGQGGDVGLPPLPPTKRAKPEALAEPRTPPRFRNSVRRNLGEIPYTPYSSITPNYPDSTPGLSPSPGYAATRKNIDFSPNDSFSPRSPQLSPEPWSPLGPAFSRGDITRKTIRKGKPLKAEETLGDAEFWQHVKSDDGTCSADTRDNVSPSLSQRQNAFFPTDSSTPRSSQLSPEPLSPPGPAFWRGDITQKTKKRLTPIKEETSIDLSSRSLQLSPEPLSPPGPAFSRGDITRKTIRKGKPRKAEETLGDAEFWQHVKSDDGTCSADTRDNVSPSLSQRQNAFFPTDSSTPRSSQLSPEPLSPPGPAFWRGDITQKTKKRLTPIKEETSIDLSSRSLQLSPEPLSPPGPAFSRGDITRKTIRKGKPRKAEETLGDAEFWQHVKSDDGTCSADTRDNVSPSLSQRQNAFFPTDSSTPRSSQLSPEPLSPPGPAFWRGDSTHKTSKRLTPIKEETSIDLFSPSSTQRSPQPLSPLGPAFSRDDITRKPIRRRKPVTEEPSTDLLPPRSSQLSPEQFSPRVTAFPRDIPQTTKQRKPPKETLGDAEFWQHIKSDDVSCSSDTSDYGPPPLPPRQRQTESSGRNLNENVPFSRPRTVGHGQTQASLRGLDETVPFSNPGKARRQQPVSNLTSRTYQNFIQQNKMAVIMFYSSASGGPLDPNTLSSHSITAPGGDTPVFASVDCAKEAGLCAGEGVQSYPFYKLYHRGYLLNAVKEFAMLNNGP